MKARKLANFQDRDLDRQVQEICDSFILRDLGGSNRKWIINGINIVMGTDTLGNPVEYPTLSIMEIAP
ncbi:hypothetical protein F6V30_13975 [Oryzomonas sagensis]|uniref:Uncharacterized protein n=1 Tax=Oryzomonas sagensis TaxID=2603857 RepID=A0ABQ6TL89_9BACT|nr:hypothetical protein [Oryzomonas sagensis]KAB0668941.1 hypothetical protein F6V30_13975 [Oryzomonas sagensis]